MSSKHLFITIAVIAVPVAGVLFLIGYLRTPINAQCLPYRCNDGTVIASCTEDGHVINYFIAPCQLHGGDKQ